MFFETDIEYYYLILAALLMLLLVFRLYKVVKLSIPSRERYILFGFRALAVLMLLLIALNPYTIEKHPEPDGFYVSVLSDFSGSMHLADTEGKKSRVSVVENALNNEGDKNLRTRLDEEYDLRLRGFSDRLISGDLKSFDLQGGVTAIGSSLKGLLDSRSDESKDLGAVVLMSDGISLQGDSIFEAAKTYRNEEVPITVIGVGEELKSGDLKIEFIDVPEEAVFGEEFELTVRFENQFKEEVNSELLLMEGDRVIDKLPVSIGEKRTEEFGFKITPERQGLHIYRVKIAEAHIDDLNPTTDIDYAAVNIREPDVMRVMYLSAHMTDYYRFMKMAVNNEPGFQFRAAIQIGEEKYHYSGLDESESEKVDRLYPEAELLMKNSIIIADASLFSVADKEFIDRIKSFLEYRGGGLLVIGPLAHIPEEHLAMLPARKGENYYIKSRQNINFMEQPVFHEAAGGSLFSAPAPFVEKQKRVFAVTDASVGAWTVSELKTGNIALSMMQAYGAGRVIYMGSDASWRWKMDSDRGAEQHDIYWKAMFKWLGSGGKPRVEAPLQGTVQALDEDLDLDVVVRNGNFKLSEDARVRAVVRLPDGRTLPEQNLTPSILEPGRFEGISEITEPGEYNVKYRIEFNDGEYLEQDVYFAGEYTGVENTDLRFRENELRDIARISGGDYFHYRDIDDISSLTLSSKIPTYDEYHYWTRNIFFIILFLAVVSGEWVLRRRIGLR